MKCRLLLDSRLFPKEETKWLRDVRDEFQGSDFEVYMSYVPVKGMVHENDLESFSGLAFAVAGIAIAMARLLKKPVENWTYSRLQAEVTAFLKLKGFEQCNTEDVMGFENLAARNGKPCVITVIRPGGRKTRLYVGLTKEILVVSPVEFDWRAF